MTLFDFTYSDPGYELNSVKWKSISSESKKFFGEFPFFKDPDFKELPILYQRFIMGYSLKDLKGFFLYDCYKFANQKYDMQKISAAVGANNCLNNPKIKPFLKKIDWMRVERMGFTAERILEEESALAYSDITNYLDEDGLCPVKNLKELPAPIRRAIKSFEIVEVESEDKDGKTHTTKKYKLKVWDKGASLNRLQRVKGMHKDSLKITGGQTNLNITTDMDATDAAKVYAQFMKGEE